MSHSHLNLQGISMLEQLCWAFFHGQTACEAAFLGHSTNCQVTIGSSRTNAAFLSEGSCQACLLKGEAPFRESRDQEQQTNLELPMKFDVETITDDCIIAPIRETALNDAVTITSESNNTQEERSSDRLVRQRPQLCDKIRISRRLG